MLQDFKISYYMNSHVDKLFEKWETKLSVPWFDCDESLTWRDLNSNQGHFCGFTPLSFLWRIVFACLVVCRWQCGMAHSDDDHSRSRRPSVEDRGWSDTCRVLGGRTIERSGDAVCVLHRARGDDECGFFGWASKPRLTGCQWFGLKTIRTVCQWFDLKITRTVSPDLASKLMAPGFPVCASKPTTTVWWFRP
jgi:hypothetical protein